MTIGSSGVVILLFSVTSSMAVGKCPTAPPLYSHPSTVVQSRSGALVASNQTLKENPCIAAANANTVASFFVLSLLIVETPLPLTGK